MKPKEHVNLFYINAGKKRYRALLVNFILELLGAIILFAFVYHAQTYFSEQRQHENSEIKLDIAVERLDTYQCEFVDNQERYDSFSQAKVDTLSYFYDNNPEQRMDMDAMAAQWELEGLYIVDTNGKVLFSSGTEADFSNEALNSLIHNLKPVTQGNLAFYASKMDNGSILVGARDSSAFQKEQAELTDPRFSLHSIKVGTNGYIVAVDNETKTIHYSVHEENIGKLISDIKGTDAIMNSGYSGTITIGNERYYCSNRTYGSYTLISFAPHSDINSTVWNVVSVSLLLYLLIVTCIILYIHFIRGEESDKSINSDEGTEYKVIFGRFYINIEVERKIRHILLIAGILIAACSFYSQTLVALSAQSNRSILKLQDVSDVMDENQAILVETKNDYNQEYGRRAQNLAYLIEQDPSMLDDDRIGKLAERIQIRDIYVFDENGFAVATNTVFKDFELSNDENNQSYIFWNVINGYEDLVIQDAQMDDTIFHTYTQYVGTKRLDAKGMVQLGVNPKRLESRIEATQMKSVLPNIAIENGGKIYAVRKEDNTFIYHPNEKMIGKSALDSGLLDSSLTDDYSGYQTIDDTSYYISTMEYGDNFVVVAVPVSSIEFSRLPMTCLITIASLLIIFIVCFLSILRNKKDMVTVDAYKKNMEEHPNQDVQDSRYITLEDSRGKQRTVESLMSRFDFGSKIKWVDMTPEQKLMRIIFLLSCGICIFIVIFIASERNGYDSSSILSYIIHQKWEKNINIFSLSYIAIVFMEIMVATTIIRKILILIIKNMGTHVETIGRLVDSFIKYFSVIGAVFYGLSFVGVDTQTLLASAGILTLVIGLGAQSMVSDILAGISIVFEGEFRVGDIVTIGDFRGTVLEIGIRSTKIEDGTHNIKIINNSAISGVLNMTRKYSFAICDVGIDYAERLERVESILSKEFAHMKERLPAIQNGPFYKGVVALGDSAVVIRILAQCKEKDRIQLGRDLNREIKILFDQYDINIPYPQIVVNQPVTKSDYVSYADKQQSDEFNKEQKEQSKDAFVDK